MTPLLLILAVFANLQGIRGALTTQPIQKEFCDYDAFISSGAINDKVFLHPWNDEERQGDWYKNRGYCADHCAEMVVINSGDENDLFLAFMRSIGMTAPGVWLGAEVDDNVPFTNWANGDPSVYSNLAAGEYSSPDHSCVSANRAVTPANLWYNDPCTLKTAFIACQRPANWTICE